LSLGFAQNVMEIMSTVMNIYLHTNILKKVEWKYCDRDMRIYK
jgi:hypothetical protein